jgi:hypothetical protein
METQFRTTIAELWRALRMPPPRFGEDNRIVLQIDGDPVELIETPDGENLLVLGRVGELAGDGARGAEQIRDILRANLAHMLRFSACVGLDRPDGEAPGVIVQSLYAYRERSIDNLGALIQEVAHLRSLYGAMLGLCAPENSLSYLAEADAGATIFRL